MKGLERGATNVCKDIPAPNRQALCVLIEGNTVGRVTNQAGSTITTEEIEEPYPMCPPSAFVGWNRLTATLCYAVNQGMSITS